MNMKSRKLEYIQHSFTIDGVPDPSILAEVQRDIITMLEVVSTFVQYKRGYIFTP
jgi:hypothetical protein